MSVPPEVPDVPEPPFHPEIVVRDVPDRAAIIAETQSLVEELARVYPHITRMRVRIQPDSSRHQHGALYTTHIDLHESGKEIVVDRDPGDRRSHEDPGVALRDAFRAARRQLDDHEKIRRHEVKRHTQRKR